MCQLVLLVTLFCSFIRLGRDEGDGAWCPSGVVQPNTEEEYLQIELPVYCVVTNVATQGRYVARMFYRCYSLFCVHSNGLLKTKQRLLIDSIFQETLETVILS